VHSLGTTSSLGQIKSSLASGAFLFGIVFGTIFEEAIEGNAVGGWKGERGEFVSLDVSVSFWTTFSIEYLVLVTVDETLRTLGVGGTGG